MIGVTLSMCCAIGVAFADGKLSASRQAAQSIDWVEYYKSHPYGSAGFPGFTGGPAFVSPSMQWAVPGGRIQWGGVFVSPNIQWAVPSSFPPMPPAGPPAVPDDSGGK